MSNLTIAPEVRSILERSTITEDRLVLPIGRLDPKLYQAINKVLVMAGGKWKGGKTQAHVFEGDPRIKLGLALETGVVVNEKKKFQAFYTPSSLADELAIQAGVAGCRVLEPSAGHGAIVEACLKYGARQVDCVEIRDECRDKLIGRGRVVTITDFLQLDPYEKFDRVVMNPPFAGNQDVSHVKHALSFLKEGGKLVSVMFGNLDRRPLQELIAGRDYSIRG